MCFVASNVPRQSVPRNAGISHPPLTQKDFVSLCCVVDRLDFVSKSPPIRLAQTKHFSLASSIVCTDQPLLIHAQFYQCYTHRWDFVPTSLTQKDLCPCVVLLLDWTSCLSPLLSAWRRPNIFHSPHLSFALTGHCLLTRVDRFNSHRWDFAFLRDYYCRTPCLCSCCARLRVYARTVDTWPLGRLSCITFCITKATLRSSNMAVRRPRLAKSRSHSPSKRSSHRRDDDTPEPSTSHLPHVNPFLTAPSSLSRRRLRNTGGLQLLNAPVLVLPGRRRLVQQGRQAQFPGVQGHGRQGDHNTGGDGGPDAHMVNDEPPFSDAVYFPNEDDASRVPCISNRQKKLNQWNRWSTEVIPSLVPLWRAYLRKTSNLRIPALPKNTEGSECFCDSGGRSLHVTCILFDRTSLPFFFFALLAGADNSLGVEQIVLRTCACASAPSQLMAMGLFGCAPIAPSLAVDLRLLQFVKTLFVRLTPNTTAWCEALAVFLQERGYGLTTQVSSPSMYQRLPGLTVYYFLG
jgi:hypothetical protein